MENAFLMQLLLAFSLSIVLVLLLKPVGKHLKLLDHPGGRKNHDQPVLVIGGIVMVLAFNILLHWFGYITDSTEYLLYALSLICAVGVLDDVYQLSSRKLFLAQSLACLLIVLAGDVRVYTLGNLLGFGVLHTGAFDILFTFVCALGVINAVNMSDGMDGLAGSLIMVSAVWFAVLAHLSGQVELFVMLLVMLGVVSGFLVFNMRSVWRSKACIFMGNAGSMSLGLLIFWFAVKLAGMHGNSVTPITAVWVIALPLMDMARVMFSRIRQGKSPFVGDHLHLHHMLSSVGYSVGQVVVIKSLVSALLGAVGVGGWLLGMPEWTMFYLLMMTFATYFYMAGAGWRRICHLIERRNIAKRT